MKWLLLLAAFLCSVCAQGADHHCGRKHTNIGDLTDVQKQLLGVDLNFGWFSVSKNDVKQAPCKSQKPPTEQEMLSYLNSLEKGPRHNEVVDGVSFQNEDPALLKIFGDMHGAKQSVSTSCGQVLCVMQELYGPKEGLQLLYLMAKYGFNGSYKAVKGAVPWKAEQLDDILTMFADWPAGFFPVQYGKTFVHMKSYMGGLNVIANSQVAVFGVWNGYSSPMRQAILFHEMGHNIAKFGQELEPEWLRLSDWKRDGDPHDFRSTWKVGKQGAMASSYAATNPFEDFAETVTAYRYSGAKLKQEHPDKYEYIKNRVFKGLEFESEVSCHAAMAAR